MQLQAARAAFAMPTATRSLCSSAVHASKARLSTTQIPLRRSEAPFSTGLRRLLSSAKTDGEDNKTPATEEKAAEEQQKEESIEEKLGKELEKKDREIIDLKVSSRTVRASSFYPIINKY